MFLYVLEVDIKDILKVCDNIYVSDPNIVRETIVRPQRTVADFWRLQTLLPNAEDEERLSSSSAFGSAEDEERLSLKICISVVEQF